MGHVQSISQLSGNLRFRPLHLAGETVFGRALGFRGALLKTVVATPVKKSALRKFLLPGPFFFHRSAVWDNARIVSGAK